MKDRKLNVLVIDDHHDTVAMLRTWLAHQGHHAVGRTDLNDLERTLVDEQIDVLLLDLMFPVTDATGHIHQIRLKFPKLKIVVMSGTADFKLTVKAIEAGADSYITKPIELDVLGRFLENVGA